jgi:hypothetical protein
MLMEYAISNSITIILINFFINDYVGELLEISNKIADGIESSIGDFV